MASDRKSTLKLGIILLVISTLFWLTPLLVPFLELSGKGKVVLTALLLIAAEILFWAGVFFAGKEAAKKFRGRLNPKNWFNGEKEKEKDKDL
ncbi:transporter suffix domain-containing protein [Peribacillus sp. SCS-26]|uniref:transporter suffix domain-containing protein n=1 Tax=Paraperibacillus marinus TaxID=3115295 RepID=UPI003905BCAF